MEGEQQAGHVAAYRTVNRIETVLTVDAQRKAEARQKAEAAMARAKHNG